VTVYERADYIGGLLALGIPDFKLDKEVLRRRLDVMEKEGIRFETGANVGVDIPAEQLLRDFDAICLACGSTVPRDLDVSGRELDGVHFAMDYLTQQNRLNSGEELASEPRLTAEGKRVVILGGGDTGADCLGTAHRQGAELVNQFELLEEPPLQRFASNPWPEWPMVLRSSAAHEEGGVRDYGILTKSFSGSNGKVERLHAVRVEWSEPPNGGRPAMTEVPGSEFEVETELVLLAMGFLHPQHEGLVNQLGVELDGRGNVSIGADRMSTVPGVFAAGDTARGQSLVVWAIAEGRETARAIDLYLMGETSLPHSLPATI
jgi:glutamate synthase (NADPH/NADH) small chain